MNFCSIRSQKHCHQLVTPLIYSDLSDKSQPQMALASDTIGSIIESKMDESLKNEARTDEAWMEDAIAAANTALGSGEVPVGAIVVLNGKLVGRGWNSNLSKSDPTAHAEIVALREAATALGNHRLIGCELFCTIEPCAMCAGALIHSRIKRLVYGADDPKAGAVHSVMQVLNHPQLNHQMEVRGGVLSDRCAELLQSFFRARREAPRPPIVDSR